MKRLDPHDEGSEWPDIWEKHPKLCAAFVGLLWLVLLWLVAGPDLGIWPF